MQMDCLKRFELRSKWSPTARTKLPFARPRRMAAPGPFQTFVLHAAKVRFEPKAVAHDVSIGMFSSALHSAHDPS